MKLRELKMEDAPFMLEWMHDPTVVKHMMSNFREKTLADCEAFINAVQTQKSDMHLAVVDENDEYYGTVSLKHIENSKAEFAITVHKKAMGKGYARFAMEEIIRIGFENLGLNQIYWCVSKENERARRFYDKSGYMKVLPESLGGVKLAYSAEQIANMVWYSVSR